MKRLGGLCCAAMAVFASCTPYDDYYYDYGYYDTSYYAYDVNSAYAAANPYGVYFAAVTAEAPAASIDPTAAAAAIASRAPDYYTPASCVVASSSGPTVTLVLSGCTGPFGAKKVDGTVTITLAQENEQLRFAVKSIGLKVAKKEHILDFNAAATATGAQRVVTIDSRSRAPSQVNSRSSTGTITWTQGDPCVSVNGQGSTTRNDTTSSSTITNLRMCAGQCPTEGTVTVQGMDGTFSGQFDGSAELRMVGPNGSDENVNLKCGK